MSILFNHYCLFFFSIASILYSVSAPPHLMELYQPDGSIIPARMFGHEYYNWIETEDGYVIDWVEDESRQGWYYCELDDEGKFHPSFISAVYPAPFDLHISKYLREISPKVRNLDHGYLSMESAQDDHLHRSNINGGLKPLVFLVDFSDEQKEYSRDQFQSLIFEEDLNPSSANLPSNYTMSVRDYFNEISNGKQEIIGDNGSVADWKRAKNSYSYYVDGTQGTGEGNHGMSRSAAALVVEVAMAIEDEGFDFSQYDNGNGAIDVVILIVAGKGGQTDNHFWPHMFVVPQYCEGACGGNGLEDIDSNAPYNDDDYFSLDGVVIHKYIVIQEKYAWSHSGASMGDIHPIGTICHELGHVLGLPDLYDTSENDAAGIGEWGLMGSGNWQRQTSPAYMSAWSRYRMGYIDPMVLENVTSVTLTIPPAEEHAGQTSYILPMNSHTPQEYLILENRQNIGSDQWLEESGLFVWHVDETITDMYPALNAVNANPDFYGVNLLQADGDGDLYSSSGSADTGDPYPYGTTSVLAGNTNPNTDTYDYDRDADGDIDMGIDSGIGLTDIEELNGLITLKATNPNMQGQVLGYDEGNFEGIAFPEVSGQLEWAGIRINSDVWETHSLNDSVLVLLTGIQIAFPPSFSTVAEVTDYTIKIWKGWTGNKPERLLYTYSGIVEWSPNEYRDGGWGHILLTDQKIIWIKDDYYIEIHYEGSGYFYFFDQGIYSDNISDGMSYYRGNSDATCLPLSNVSSAENGDWNIRVVLFPICGNADDGIPEGFCDCNGNVEDCTGECGGSTELDECGVCNGDGIPEGFCDCDGNMEDCTGECGGNAVIDNCDVCDNDSSNNCTQDCVGIWGGDAEIDICNVCDGGITDITACLECPEGLETDCLGVCSGDAVIDDCGVCNGSAIEEDNGTYTISGTEGYCDCAASLHTCTLCAVLDPEAYGNCDISLGYAFTGQHCEEVIGCGQGDDVDWFFTNYDECGAGCQNCHELDPNGYGECELELGWGWTGETCELILGCGPGEDEFWFHDQKNICNSRCNYYAFLSNEIMELPSEYTLSIYPNPFNPITNIQYEVSEYGMMRIVIYDLDGREVNTLINDYKQPGNYTISWSGIDNNDQSLSSGIYLVVLESTQKILQTRKIVLLK